MAKPSLKKSATPNRDVDLEGETWVHIGMCSGNFEAVRHVESILTPAGITASIEGSIMYSIAVLERDIQRASDLLKEDQDASVYHITVYIS
jgi:hypothetical protein